MEDEDVKVRVEYDPAEDQRMSTNVNFSNHCYDIRGKQAEVLRSAIMDAIKQMMDMHSGRRIVEAGFSLVSVPK